MAIAIYYFSKMSGTIPKSDSGHVDIIMTVITNNCIMNLINRINEVYILKILNSDLCAFEIFTNDYCLYLDGERYESS